MPDDAESGSVAQQTCCWKGCDEELVDFGNGPVCPIHMTVMI